MPRKGQKLTEEEKARRRQKKHEKIRDSHLSRQDPGYKFKDWINVPKKPEVKKPKKPKQPKKPEKPKKPK